MAAVEVNLAEAVKDELNATTFSQSFTALRQSLVDIDLKGVKDLCCYVTTGQIEVDTQSRNSTRWDYEIQIGFAKQTRVETDSAAVNSRVDPLKLLVEEVIKHFVQSTKRRLSDVTTAVCVSAKNTVPYSEQFMRDNHAFLSVVSLTYRVVQ